MVPLEVAPGTTALKIAATWAAFGGLAIALIGLVLELAGAYLLASAFQPFVLGEFAKLAVKVSWLSLMRRPVTNDISASLTRLIETMKKFGQDEALNSFAGLSLICVGISLQILSVVVLIGVEVLRLLSGH